MFSFCFTVAWLVADEILQKVFKSYLSKSILHPFQRQVWMAHVILIYYIRNAKINKNKDTCEEARLNFDVRILNVGLFMSPFVISFFSKKSIRN